jgi:hypothetical protein
LRSDLIPMDRRRGVDSIIATVLVVAVALAASLAVSGFVFGVTGRAQDSAKVTVTGSALVAADFVSTSPATVFTCASASPGSDLSLTNTGTLGVSVASVSINWAGSSTTYAVSGSCSIGAVGSPTSSIYIVFPTTTKLAPSAIAAQNYSGTVTLSNGAQLLFTGAWQ